MAKATGARGRLESKRQPVTIPASVSHPASELHERHLDLLATAVLAALKVALDALPVPALVTDRSGNVVCSNVHARAVLGEAGATVRWPVPANDPAGSSSGWDVTPIEGAGPRAWSLLILRTPGAPLLRRWNLTERQTEVLNLVVRGLTNTGIAETLGIRPCTVEFHISAIFDKVGVNSRAALIVSVIGR